MCPVNASSPTSSSFIRAMRSIASSGRSVYTSSGSRTFSSSVIEPNSAPDWYITPNRRWIRSSIAVVGGDDVVAVDVDVPGDRRIEPDHVLHQRALAAARAAEDAEHLAAAHLEVDVLEDGHAVVAGVHVLDADDDVARPSA